MLFASIAEMFSIAAVIPFLSALTAPERLFINPLIRLAPDFLRISAPEQLLLPLTIVFGVMALIAAGGRLLLLWASSRLSYSFGADLSIGIFRRTLYQPYAVHCSRNSSEIIDGITNKTSCSVYVISQLLNLFSSSLLLLGILIIFVSVAPYLALSTFCGFGLIYVLVILLFRQRLLANGARVANESTKLIRSLQEGLGGIRDVLIDGSQAAHCQVYSSADTTLRKAQAASAFIQSSPRFAVEALGMILIAGLAYSLAMQPDGVDKAIPVLGALALGAQRLLPLFQQIYAAYVGIQSNRASLQDALDLLDQPLPAYVELPQPKPIPFEKSIRLERLSFRYNDQAHNVLQDIDLIIEKGSRVGFIGVTGSGKSTLLDLIMGLLTPTAGAIKIDDHILNQMNYRSWQARIAHVPQTIFLSDGTVAENIAFGASKESIDQARIHEVAKKAQIASTVESWPDKYNTKVGERGVRLSGGQRQRLGITRALYKKADVIVFDEATSALDSETEQTVMQEIEKLGENITILIIAHRISTLKKCSKIIELLPGNINIYSNIQQLQELNPGKTT